MIESFKDQASEDIFNGVNSKAARKAYVFTSPFEKGGLMGIFLKISPLNPLLQRAGLNDYRKTCPQTLWLIAARKLDQLYSVQSLEELSRSARQSA